MPDLDLAALRRVAEAADIAGRGAYLDAARVLALVDRLEAAELRVGVTEELLAGKNLELGTLRVAVGRLLKRAEDAEAADARLVADGATVERATAVLVNESRKRRGLVELLTPQNDGACYIQAWGDARAALTAALGGDEQ